MGQLATRQITRRQRILAPKPPDDWMPRIVLINGPPRSGKDTLAGMLRLVLGGLPIERFSRPLKYGVADAFALDRMHAELTKDEPSDMLFGMSYRQMQINMFENWLRPQFGDDALGMMCAQRVKRNWKRCYRGIIIPDAGRIAEVETFINQMPSRRAVLVRLHRDGCEWDNREPVHTDCVKSCDVYNSGSPDEMLVSVRGHLRLLFPDEEQSK